LGVQDEMFKTSSRLEAQNAVRVAQWYDRCSKLTSAPVTSEVVGSIPGQTHSSCDREGDSLRQRRFPPGAPVSSYMHYKSPNIVYRANNVLVDTQLSTQYFKLKIQKCKTFSRSTYFLQTRVGEKLLSVVSLKYPCLQVSQVLPLVLLAQL
jgi:hypothetical protein